MPAAPDAAPHTAHHFDEPAAGGSPIAVLDDVSKLYGAFAALRRVTLQLDPGQCYLLLGENGAGKSTMLRMLAGLLKPTYGLVTVFGEAPFEVRERIGYMGHAAMLYDEYSAAENLRYFATLYGGAPCLGVESTLRLVGLDPSLGRPLRQYSQGMRQRVSLARVLLPQPQLLLLDEPFSNMDRASALQMLALLQELRGQGQTILLTTHQRELAEPIADAVLVLAGGRLSGVSRPGQMIEAPAELDAAAARSPGANP